ncbi:MAG: phage tail sheath subtilisin-like domain-containing protein, partial [Gemmatimonadaceae bacterium]
MNSIIGVETSIALFVGLAPSGPTDWAVQLNSFADYQREFGGLDRVTLLGYSVKHFFENGGAEAYALRITGGSGDSSADKGLILDTASPDFHAGLLASFGPGSITDAIDLFNLVCVPGLADAATISALQQHCVARRAFLIVDCAETATSATVSGSLAAISGPHARNSALYFPWVRSSDPLQPGTQRDFPPCGFVAGVFARVDRERAVWKAPAGSEARISGAVAPSIAIGDTENARLNPQAVNCLRALSIFGTVIWGARTLHGDNARASEWKYVPVRRTALFIEESLYRGTQWVVHEPNDEPLWAQI